MSKTVQFKRGNANVSASYVGAQGEITINTDNFTLNVHDGTTPGGYSILNTNVSNIGNLVVTNQTITGTSANTNITISPTNANVVLTANLLTPNIAINRYTIQSVGSGTSLTLPAESDGANVELVNNFSNIKWTVLDSSTDVPYTVTLGTDSYLTLPGYIKSTLGGGEIQFGGTQGVLIYANFATGHTGISLSDTGVSDIFSNGDLRLSTNYSGVNKQWLFSTNGTLTTTGNTSTANLLISHVIANNTVQTRTLANSDLQLTATDGITASSIYLWANNQRMSFNTVSNAFDFNFNGQLSATDFTASKNSNIGYSFYAEGSGYSGFRHSSGPPDLISIVHEGNVFAGFYGNYTTQLYGNLVVSSDGETFGSFPDAYVQVYSNVDTYSQFVLQNINDGSDASTDVVVTADNGDDSTYYINMGILGSNHAVEDFFGDVRNYDDGYLIVVGNDATGGLSNVGNLILGSTNGIVKTFVGNIAEANVVTTVSEGLLNVAGNVAATYFIGNGSQLTGITGTSYSDANVVSLLASFGSNIISTTGNISADNLIATTRTYANTGIFGYGTDGSGLIGAPIVISGNSTTSIIGTNGIANNVSSNLTIKTLNSNISLQISGADKTWIFDTTGNLTAPGTILGNLRTDETVIALGDRAGSSNQGNLSVAVGSQAGQTDQGIQATAIGAGAGSSGQAAGTVAVGTNAGAVNQGLRAVAVGSLAGSLNQGEYAVAIGNFAGGTNQANNSIILNATGSSLDAGTSGFFVSPIASNTTGNVLQYNTSTKELSYSDTISISGNINSGNITSTGNITALGGVYTGDLSVTGNILQSSGTVSFGNTATITTSNYQIGYRDVPQVIFTSNATLSLTDAGKHYYSSNSANVITVPNNATVSFNIGTAISIVQQGTANLTINPDGGVTMYLAGNATSSSRLLGNYGMATIMKVDTDTWFINGTGLT
jgi:hypothetical protein